jgi:6-phosphogluconolactonase
VVPLGVAAVTVNPEFFAVHPNHQVLFVANEYDNPGESGNTVSSFAIDAGTGKLTLLNKISARGDGPCSIVVDKTGKNLLLANYGSGSVAVLPIAADGRLGEATAFIQHEGSGVNPNRQKGPHAHCVILSPDNRFALVSDLGLDKVLVYRFDAAKGTLAPNDPPFARVAPGAGSRHLAFHPNGKIVYCISEMGSTMTTFEYAASGGTLKEIQTVSTLPADFKAISTGAEVQVNRAGTVLYGSNRGHDSIAVFSIDPHQFTLTPVEHVPTLGRTPRYFTIDPTGKYLFAANQGTGNVVVFAVDAKSGKLTPTGTVLTDAPAPVCVEFVERK